MTKREREQVVELLRCAADVSNVLRASTWLVMRPRVRDLAYAAMEQAEDDLYMSTPIGDLYETACLEAAQRVEDGDYP